MLIDCIVRPEQIKEHLLLPYCSYIKKGVRIETPGNSVVVCSQWFPFVETATACFPDTDLSQIKIGLNFVSIKGEMPQEEDLHVHLAMLVGIVVEGTGYLLYKKNEEILKEVVECGDVVFVPRNTLHSFEGSPEVKYAILEFGPVIDYQKHHYE